MFAAAIEPGEDATSDGVSDGVADPGAAVVVARPLASRNPERETPGQRVSDLGLFEPPIGIEPMTYSLRVNRSSRLS